MLSRRGWIILLTILMLLLAPLPARSSSALARSRVQAVPARKVCKTVTKKVHGKKTKVRVCHTVKATPTATSTPTATAASIPIPSPTPTATATPCETTSPPSEVGATGSQIVGPAQGAPSAPLAFQLVDGSAVGADRWEQVMNPDRYTGTDYVTSFSLLIERCADGSARVVAPAAGRYEIAAVKGSGRWTTYLLVRPPGPIPAIRGAAFTGNGPVNRPYAARMLSLARRVGMTWAEISETGGIDLDQNPLQVVPDCGYCASVSLDDLGWLIDEAHRQGLSVVLHPTLWARASQPAPGAPPFYLASTANGFVGDLPALLASDSPLIPGVMQAYVQYMMQMAQIAQQHHAEALVVGSETNAGPYPLLWQEQSQWSAMLTQLRQTFSGKLWLGPILGGCISGTGRVSQAGVSDPALWAQADAIDAPTLSGLHGSGQSCADVTSPSTTVNAESMAHQIRAALPQTDAGGIQAQTHLPIIWRELYTLPLDGVNELGASVYNQIGTGSRDNQEIVDFFEAQMRAISEYLRDTGQPADATGYFLWSVGVSPGFFNTGDPLMQPELAAAIANWWGGDTAGLQPCMGQALPAGTLFRADFEPGPCPIIPQDSFLKGLEWSIIPDASSPGNSVLRGTQSNSAAIPAIGSASWRDYTVHLRVRVMGGPEPQATVLLRIQPGTFDNYSVALGYGDLMLAKSSNGKYVSLARASLPGGPQLGRWYDLTIMCSGPSVTVSLDGVQTIAVTDTSDPILNGGVGLYVGGASGNGIADFDDVTVTVP